MEMRASEDIKQGEDVTPPICPLTFALHDSFLDTHCSSCFAPLPCCCSLPLSSAELRLLRSLPHTSDLRAALRLLLPLTLHPPPPRLFGLLTNRDNLMSSSESDVVSKIREGAREMAKARGNLSEDVVWEEAALCMVVTNAVEVQDNKSGSILGIAVYDKNFSWINHSCSPNACYRFLLSEPNATPFWEKPKMRIAPHIFNTNEAETQGNSGGCINSELKQGSERYGPRIIVRSIKPITEGEEVTVAYTDLLQPKKLRQSELWSKYQFVCYCRRCTASSPPSYLDMALEEITCPNLEFLSSSSDYNLHKDEANQKLTDCMDEVITEYLSVGDPESCCKKLEKMLTSGLQGELLETEKGKIRLNFRLHPTHHLALNAYTALASAYKIRSVDLLALHSDIDGRHLEAFDMRRTSAAYSLLLAGATDHVFRSESSLIASAANFWASAGESLLILARSSEWDLFVTPALPVAISSLEKHKCSNCSLMDRFQLNPFLSEAGNADSLNISSEFLACITNMTRKVWGFLIHNCCYLQIFEDPIDFRLLGKSSDVQNFRACSDKDFNYETGYQESICGRVKQQCNDEERINIFQLGAHCLIYGGYLANICYGDNSHLTRHIKNVLYDEEKSAKENFVAS